MERLQRNGYPANWLAMTALVKGRRCLTWAGDRSSPSGSSFDLGGSGRESCSEVGSVHPAFHNKNLLAILNGREIDLHHATPRSDATATDAAAYVQERWEFGWERGDRLN